MVAYFSLPDLTFFYLYNHISRSYEKHFSHENNLYFLLEEHTDFQLPVMMFDTILWYQITTSYN